MTDDTFHYPELERVIKGVSVFGLAAQVVLAGFLQWKIWRKTRSIAPAVFVLAIDPQGQNLQPQHQQQNGDTSLVDHRTLLLFMVAVVVCVLAITVVAHKIGPSLGPPMMRAVVAIVIVALPLSAYIRRPHLLQVLRRELMG